MLDGILILLTVGLAMLKLVGILAISWLLVFLPVMILLTYSIALIVVVLVLAVLGAIISP